MGCVATARQTNLHYHHFRTKAAPSCTSILKRHKHGPANLAFPSATAPPHTPQHARTLCPPPSAGLLPLSSLLLLVL